MLDTRLARAVMLVISLDAWMLVYRFGVGRPGSRMWQTCLFFAAWGAILAVTSGPMLFGLANARNTVSFLLAFGAVCGGLSGLVYHWERRWRVPAKVRHMPTGCQRDEGQWPTRRRRETAMHEFR